VTVDELIALVNIAHGTAQASVCPHSVPGGEDADTLIIRAVIVRSTAAHAVHLRLLLYVRPAPGVVPPADHRATEHVSSEPRCR